MLSSGKWTVYSGKIYIRGTWYILLNSRKICTINMKPNVNFPLLVVNSILIKCIFYHEMSAKHKE